MPTWSDCHDWSDQWWDDDRGLLWNPPGSFDDHGMRPRSAHMVPQSAWYAVGCAMRGDVTRARRIVDELRALQYDEPGAPWHGTFARFAEWQHPGPDAKQWVDYDPNWRQFIGTTFSLLQLHFDIGARDCVELAIEGEPADRVSPRYSNIALMRAWLEGDEDYAREIVRLFEENLAFDEYNSPTYYGIDLYALALWRRHPPSERFGEWGERVTADLWRDIGRWYHPGLRNLCGPYSRAYGMDMSAHVALLGLWLPDPVVPDLRAPSIEHSHDLTMAPLVELLGGAPDALTFEPGLVSQRINDDRVATGWLGDDLMMGGESGGRYRAEGQYHPATVHGRDGWLRVRSPDHLDATVHRPGVLEVDGTDLVVESQGTVAVDVEETETGLVIRSR